MANLFTPIHEETRLDYHGQPYTVHVLGRKPDLGKLWESFKQVQRENERNLMGGHDSVNQHWYETETSKQLYDQER